MNVLEDQTDLPTLFILIDLGNICGRDGHEGRGGDDKLIGRRVGIWKEKVQAL